MNQFCPRCGAFFAPDVNMEFSTTQVLCRECGLSLEDPPVSLAPSENDEDQIAYDLAEWPPEDRAIASADLVELGIPYRWEDNIVLVVPAGAEEQVDAILDEIDENALASDEAALRRPRDRRGRRRGSRHRHERHVPRRRRAVQRHLRRARRSSSSSRPPRPSASASRPTAWSHWSGTGSSQRPRPSSRPWRRARTATTTRPSRPPPGRCGTCSATTSSQSLTANSGHSPSMPLRV